MYCIINPETNRLHRATFSKSLAKMIIKNYYPEYKIVKGNYIRGRRLEPGESSKGLYGIIGTKKDSVLRIPITKESANMYYDPNSRHIEEIFLKI